VTAFEHLDEARELAATVRLNLAKAAEASDQAVMADTDAASIAFARDADRVKDDVRAGAAALARLLERLNLPSESQTLAEFRARFDEYAKVDRGVLELAVENTNLKAQRLSFGPVRQAADAFRDGLEAAVKTIPDKDRCRADRLVAAAVLAVRDVQILQAPHIAEAEDAAMTTLERQMTERETAARAAVDTLAGLVGPRGQAGIADTRGALERFAASSRQLIALSRRNTNVRSLEIALNRMPALAAACDAKLEELIAALGTAGSKAKR
jgi:hypothetical protein